MRGSSLMNAFMSHCFELPVHSIINVSRFRHFKSKSVSWDVFKKIDVAVSQETAVMRFANDPGGIVDHIGKQSKIMFTSLYVDLYSITLTLYNLVKSKRAYIIDNISRAPHCALLVV